MKKYVLSGLIMLAVLMMTACNEEELSAKEVEKEVEVAKESVDKEVVVEEEVVEEVVEEETVEPVDTESVTLNYDNTSEAVQSEISKKLAMVRGALTLQENSPWTFETIKTWFSDFEGSDDVLDVYLGILEEKGLVLTSNNQGGIHIKKIVETDKNIWSTEIDYTDIEGDLTVATYWKVVASPNAEGNLVIDITEIK